MAATGTASTSHAICERVYNLIEFNFHHCKTLKFRSKGPHMVPIDIFLSHALFPLPYAPVGISDISIIVDYSLHQSPDA